MDEHFYHMACPLCQRDVDPSQPDYYRVLPLDSEKMAVFYEKPAIVVYDLISAGGILFSASFGYPDLGYMQKAWCLHTRCLEFVDHLPLPKLYILLDLVEPTFLQRRNPPKSQYGDFYTQPIQMKQDPLPEAPVPLTRRMTERFWKALRSIFHRPISENEQLDDPPSPPSPLPPLPVSLPPEIWNMVLKYDIGRLLFVSSTASQLAGLKVQEKIPSTRFTVDILDLSGLIVQIHTISIGGRSYIGNLSCGIQDNNTKCYDLRGKNYLATKTDGIGVVDIAFEHDRGHPKWILHNPTEPFTMDFSHIENASLQSLRVIRDTFKCRAIVPSNRGPEPYFHKPPFPPKDCWVNPGILLESKLTWREDPFMYFIRATYTPFTNMTRISMDYDSQYGIQGIYVNDPKWEDKYSATFDEPQRILDVKYMVCRASNTSLALQYYFPWIQFKVNDKWAPTKPRFGIIIEEILVQGVVGLWLGKTYGFTPPHVGMVVSQRGHSTEEKNM